MLSDPLRRAARPRSYRPCPEDSEPRPPGSRGIQRRRMRLDAERVRRRGPGGVRILRDLRVLWPRRPVFLSVTGLIVDSQLPLVSRKLTGVASRIRDSRGYHRAMRTVSNILVAASLIIAAAAVASLWWAATAGDRIGVIAGALFVYPSGPLHLEDASIGSYSWPWPDRLQFAFGLPQVTLSGWSVNFVAVPLYWPALLFATAARLCSWRSARPAPGCCRRCGYDLRGNVSGVCPECGQAVERTGQAGSDP
jgi:hypothetical protein